MSIISFQFLAFAVIVTGLYFLFPQRCRWVVILCANVFFYAFAGVKYVLLVFLMAFISYIAALRLQKTIELAESALPALDDTMWGEAKKSFLSIKQFICGTAVFSVAGVWIILKYSNFFIRNYNTIAGKISEGWQLPEVAWVLPLGISFYTFHIIGYVVDVYRGKYPAEQNFAKYFTFVTFFPHVIQGPFSRFDILGSSIFEPCSFSYERLCEGCARILWGVFKKLLIADKLAISVNAIFDNYGNYPGAYVIFGMFAYCIELYADFSGYMDIVCGLSHIWGINLSENFRQPYFAKTIDEFWRRWHITLGAWFKDYVFYPISMGKIGQKLGRKARKIGGAKMGKLVPGYFALVFVWTATGLWHGANWTYLVWGCLNLLAIVSTMQLADFYKKIKTVCHIDSESVFWKIFCMIRTFILVCFFRFFSIQPSIRIAFSTLKHTAFHLNIHEIVSPGSFFVGMESRDKYAVVFGTVLIFTVDLLKEAGIWNKIKQKSPFILRNVAYAAMVILIILLSAGSSDLTGGFMYANF